MIRELLNGFAELYDAQRRTPLPSKSLPSRDCTNPRDSGICLHHNNLGTGRGSGSEAAPRGSTRETSPPCLADAVASALAHVGLAMRRAERCQRVRRRRRRGQGGLGPRQQHRAIYNAGGCPYRSSRRSSTVDGCRPTGTDHQLRDRPGESSTTHWSRTGWQRDAKLDTAPRPTGRASRRTPTTCRTPTPARRSCLRPSSSWRH